MTSVRLLMVAAILVLTGCASSAQAPDPTPSGPEIDRTTYYSYPSDWPLEVQPPDYFILQNQPERRFQLNKDRMDAKWVFEKPAVKAFADLIDGLRANGLLDFVDNPSYTPGKTLPNDVFMMGIATSAYYVEIRVDEADWTIGLEVVFSEVTTEPTSPSGKDPNFPCDTALFYIEQGTASQELQSNYARNCM